MASKENIDSEEHQEPESAAGDDAVSSQETPTQNVDTNKPVKIDSESKSLEIQDASLESAAKNDDHPETNETAPTPENPSEIAPSDEPSAERSEDAGEAEQQTDDRKAAQVSQNHDQHNFEGAGQVDDTSAGEPADPQLAKDVQEPKVAAAERGHENTEMDSSAAADKEPLADENESEAENTDGNAGKASTANAKTDRTVEAGPSEPDEDDQQQEPAQIESNQEENDKADPNAETDDDETNPLATDDQKTDPQEVSADDDVEAQTTAKADTDDDAADPPQPDASKIDAEKVSAEDVIADKPYETSGPKKSGLKIAVSAILIVAVFYGFFIFENKSKVRTPKKAKPQTSQNQALPSKAHRKQIVDIRSAKTPGLYDGQINEISALRDTLLKKQAEVLALKQNYQRGIDELENEIFDELRKADLQTFSQATENKRVLFRLKTIQRRQAYIRQLEAPYAWVSNACEQLLYLKRRVTMDLQVSEVASGIDMNRHARQMQAALQKYRPTADKLAVDPKPTPQEALETIWQRIQNKQDQLSPGRAQSINQIISEQICRGDFNGLSELSEISVETAKCIIQMQASDLFLNRITEISPGAARQLCQWDGNWIGLNGLKALSPRVAHYLFQWGGNWISLNGLSEFPSEIGEALLNWEGKQLELMGLQYTGDSPARIGLAYLARWEQSGGKLFVPPGLREKIDALHRQPG